MASVGVGGFDLFKSEFNSCVQFFLCFQFIYVRRTTRREKEKESEWEPFAKKVQNEWGGEEREREQEEQLSSLAEQYNEQVSNRPHAKSVGHIHGSHPQFTIFS